MKPRKSPPALLPLLLTNDQPFAARRLRLFFQPTRTVLVDAYVGAGPLKKQPTVKPVKLAFELDLDPPGVGSGAALSVGVRYQRSKPQLAKAIWLPATPAAVVGVPPPPPTTADKPLNKLPYTMSPAELAKLRHEMIKQTKGLEKRRKEFFYEMDVDTDPDLAELNKKPKAQVAKLHQAARVVQPVLLDRVQNRGRFGRLTDEFPDPTVKPEFKTALTLVVKYMEDLIARSGIDAPGNVLPGLDETFEAFARGDLRVTTIVKAADGTEVPYSLNGEPDSANYFLLSELAILACRADPADQFWPRLLRVFVRTQEIYCQAYAPRGAAMQTWPDFTHKTWRGPGVPSDGALADLRLKYETMGVTALENQATRNAQDAFCW